MGRISLVIVLFLYLAKNANGLPQDGSAISFGAPPPKPATSAPARPTSSASDDTTNGLKDNVGVRNNGGGNGLLADVLGVDPLGEGPSDRHSSRPPFNGGSSRPPFNGNNANLASLLGQGRCCCTPYQTCPNNDQSGQGSFLGSINPRGKIETDDDKTDPRDGVSEVDIGTRIVNNPGGGGNNHNNNQRTCPSGYNTCCYPQSVGSNGYDFGNDCRPLNQFGVGDIVNNPFQEWRQACPEFIRGQEACGVRDFQLASGRLRGQASPGEFPWTCLMLGNNNRFIGSCAIVPVDTDNNLNRGTYKFITAAHKLKALEGPEALRIRVGEYDASGFNNPERFEHKEYTVRRIVKHPDFNPNRLSNDIAVLLIDDRNPVDISPRRGVNAACYPACSNMFDYQFNNGTGVRCWVAGWGKDGENGNFQFIQNKVDVPLYDRGRCEQRLKQRLGRDNPATGQNFFLTPGEICAGGESGKDACDGDGGAPLVCQSINGRWHVVGLVAWGVGCADRDVPGVYVNVFHYLDWIRRIR